MLQTLFIIPRSIAGVPLWVWLLGVWGVVSVISLTIAAKRHGWARALREGWLTILVTSIAIVILPRLMEPAGLPVRGYGVMLLLAIIVAVGLSAYRAKRIGLDPEIIYSLAIWLVIPGIVGARLFYVIEYWHSFQRDNLIETLKGIVNVTQGGLVVYGALIAGGAALIVFIYKHKLPGLMLSDLIAPGVAVGMAIGRLGCFLNGCCYGGECSLPWAVQFPWGSPPFVEQAEKGELFLHGLRIEPPHASAPVIAAVEPNSAAADYGLKAGDRITAIGDVNVNTVDEANLALLGISGEGSVISIRIAGNEAAKTWTLRGPPARSKPVHPAQLYSAIDAFLLCLFLLAFDPYRQREGVLTALLLTIHPISRFLLEIIRVDESAVFGTAMSISQNISLMILAGAVICWIYVLSRPKGLWQPA
jgi:phosphatidylglycerol:prolipoprotein diacylglycerol transferase